MLKKKPKKKQVSTKASHKTNSKLKGESLRVDVKVGILHTVADAIYSTPAGKLREAVANARDNGASWVIIVVDQAARAIFICDNGSGITKTRFHEIFQAIGYGLGRDAREKKLSYFGLGLMSIFQLGKKVEMFTRASGTKKILKLDVDTDKIFSKENEKKSISMLNTYISLKSADESTRRNASINLLNESLSEEQFTNTWDSFTEIIIKDVNPEDLEIICDDGFADELRKWLPLKPERDEPFLKRLTGGKGKEVRRLLSDEKFCKTVDVYLGMQEDASISQLWKYFPVFRSDLTFTDDNVYVGNSATKEFAYYLVHSIAVDLQRGRDGEERETGFWVRNQNFLVKSADFLERGGPGRKIKPLHEPLKPWVFGEIFHKDMNRFLTVSRNDFLFNKTEFREFQKEIIQIISPLNEELRTIHEKKSKILNGLVEPFAKLRQPKGPIQATEKKLREIMQHSGSEKEFREDALKRLKKARNKEIECEESRVDILLQQTKKPVTLGQDEDALVKIDPRLQGKVEECDVTWDVKNKKVVVSLSPDLFQPKTLVFLGVSFELVYVAQKEATGGVSVNVDRRKIYVNPFNRELARYTVSIFDVYFALQVANAISNTQKELFRNVLALLGAESEVTRKYITPFGDDLRRTLELTRRRA